MDYRGFTLPLTDANHPLSTNSDDGIFDSIENILGTILFQPLFSYQVGSRLYELLGEPNSNIIPALCKMFIKDAISLLDPRVKILDTTVTVDNANIYITINMQDITTGNNLTYNKTI